MAQKWAEIFSEKFNLNLGQELGEWFSLGFYQKSLDIEFNEPVAPTSFMSGDSGIVWGGQMLPDTLPVLENGCGDTICVRFNETGEIQEYILWEHETGSLKPIANQLSEVLLYYLINASREDQLNDFDEQLQSPVIQWVLCILNFTQDQLSQLRPLLLEEKLSDKLLSLGIAQIPMYEKLTENCLETALLRVSREIGGGNIAKKIHVDWETFHSWFVEPELIPPKKLKKLSKKLKISEEEFTRQDWPKAFQYAKDTLSIREDIGWPYIVMGRYFEKNNAAGNAIDSYYKALKCSKMTYSFTSDWNHPNYQLSYPAQKLLEYKDLLPDSILSDSYFQAAIDSDYDSIFKYWQQKAFNNEKQENYIDAYRCWYAAGWDNYVTDFMDIVLEGLVRTSQKANCITLSNLAKYHKECSNL